MAAAVAAEAAGVFERVIVLDEGRIIADAPTEELVDRFRYVSGSAAAVDSALPGDLLLALGRALADTARPGWAALAGVGRWALRPLPAPGGAGEVAFPAR